MKKQIALLLTGFLCLTLLNQCGQSKSQKLPDHPRIIFPEDDQSQLENKMAENEQLAALNKFMINTAAIYLDEALLTRDQVGRRILHVSRDAIKRIMLLSYSYRMTGEKKYLQRAEKEMLAIADFSDWNPSHFLDVAEMTMAMGIGYDWLYHDLPEKSKEKIMEAIINKGLMPSKEYDAWSYALHNWNQVCNAGMVIGALAVFEDAPRLAQEMIDRAKVSIRKPLEEYEPDGAYPEGAGYWGYGTTFHILLLDAYNKIFDDDAFEKSESLLRSADFYLHVCGPAGFYNYCDSHTGYRISPAVFWFAASRNDNSLLWYQKPLLDELINRKIEPRHIANSKGNRFLPLLVIWGSQMDSFEASEPNNLSWKGRGVNPIGLHRTSWDNKAIFIGIKGGSPGSNHAHMDAGSFVMDAKGVRWAIDLGAHGYHRLESQGLDIWNKKQTSDRWSIYRYTNYLHNTLTVDDSLQRVDGYARIIKHKGEGAFRYTMVDMTSVYEGQLDSASRGIALVDNEYVMVRDEVVNTNKESKIRWSMVTHDDVTIEDDQTAIIKTEGEVLTLKVVSPENAIIQTWPTDPPNTFEDKNPGTQVIGFESIIKPNEHANFVVLLLPNTNIKVNKQNVYHLKDW